MERIEQFPQDDWHDQDLLTKDEAAERLVEEIEITRREIDELEKLASDENSGEHAMLTKRLAAMEAMHRDLA